MESNQPPHSSTDIQSIPDAKASLALPPEIWVIVCSFLQEDRQNHLPEMATSEPQNASYEALFNFGLVCKAFYHLRGLAWRKFISASKLDGKNENLMMELEKAPRFPEMIDRRAKPRWELGRTEKLVCLDCQLNDDALHSILKGQSLKKVTIQCCTGCSQNTHNTKDLLSLPGSNIKTLNLDYSSDGRISTTLLVLALTPSLNTLITNPRSFRAICQPHTTLSLPQLRTLWIHSNAPQSISKADIVSFLPHCKTLETLHISHTISSEALNPEEVPVNMPNLTTYEGRPEFLTLIRTPALRRALVKPCSWDGGFLINDLASASTGLESVVLELTSTMDDPVMSDVEQWMELAAARASPHWMNTRSFSLIIRTAPLREWAYSARVGRTVVGELFIEYLRRPAEAMKYLFPKVAVRDTEEGEDRITCRDC